jgi:Cu2+-exporting ATPase
VNAHLPLPCYHCALPVPAGRRWRATVLDQPRDFCCPGCQAVAEAIVAGGLAPFYQHRDEASANPQALPAQPPDELALFDRDDVQRPFVRDLEEGREITLMVEGISCAACGWLIEKHLQALPGVGEARLNLSSQRLYLRWPPTTAGPCVN